MHEKCPEISGAARFCFKRTPDPRQRDDVAISSLWTQQQQSRDKHNELGWDNNRPTAQPLVSLVPEIGRRIQLQRLLSVDCVSAVLLRRFKYSSVVT